MLAENAESWNMGSNRHLTTSEASANCPITHHFGHRVSGFLGGKEHSGHNCRSSLLRCGSKNGSIIPSPENLVSPGTRHIQGLRGVLEVHTKGNRRVSKVDFIANSTTYTPLSSPKWQTSHGKYLDGRRALDSHILTIPYNWIPPNYLANATR